MSSSPPTALPRYIDVSYEHTESELEKNPWKVHADLSREVAGDEIAMLRVNFLASVPEEIQTLNQTTETTKCQTALRQTTPRLSNAPEYSSNVFKGVQSQIAETAAALDKIRQAKEFQEAQDALNAVGGGTATAHPIIFNKGQWGSFTLSLFCGGLAGLGLMGLLQLVHPDWSFSGLESGSPVAIALASVLLVFPAYGALVMAYHSLRLTGLALWSVLNLAYDILRFPFAPCRGKTYAEAAQELFTTQKEIWYEMGQSLRTILVTPFAASAFAIAHLITVFDLGNRIKYGDSLFGRGCVQAVERFWNRNIPLQKGHFLAEIIGGGCCTCECGAQENYQWNKGGAPLYMMACYQPMGVLVKYRDSNKTSRVFLWNGHSYSHVEEKDWETGKVIATTITVAERDIVPAAPLFQAAPPPQTIPSASGALTSALASALAPAAPPSASSP